MKKFLASFFVFLVTVSFVSAKPDPIDISQGPWITNVTDSSVTILWTTETDNLGWVEIASDARLSWRNSDVRRFYQVHAGRWAYGKMHSVVVTGLAKGTSYRYRICGRKVVDDSEPQEMVYGPEKSSGVFRFSTFDSSASVCRFSQVNDIHLRTDLYSGLMSQVNPDNTDFILLNGDITTVDNYCLDTLVRYDIEPLGELAHSVPVMFARGNHEGRGRNWMLSAEVFPTRTPGQFYYTFRQGPVAFIVLDAGETKPIVSKSYAGDEAYYEYLEEELEWARDAVRQPEFADAPVKVCLIHVPMVGSSDALNYSTQPWMRDHFIPMLNDAGVNLALSAHIHHYEYIIPGAFDNNFPMICNGNETRMQFESDGKTIKVTAFDLSGAVTETVNIQL